MNGFEGLITRLVKNFNAARIDYMFTGALAASYYGMPRTTMDVDVVVKAAREHLKALATLLRKAEIKVDERRIDEAFESGFKMITLKDKRTPFTVDIIFTDGKLEKKRGTILGLPTFYQTPEGLILSKLRMIKETDAEDRALKDKGDVKAILRYAEVDVKAVKRRSRREGTFSILEELKASF